jgi:hypothetical protein
VCLCEIHLLVGGSCLGGAEGTVAVAPTGTEPPLARTGGTTRFLGFDCKPFSFNLICDNEMVSNHIRKISTSYFN